MCYCPATVDLERKLWSEAVRLGLDVDFAHASIGPGGSSLMLEGDFSPDRPVCRAALDLEADLSEKAESHGFDVNNTALRLIQNRVIITFQGQY